MQTQERLERHADAAQDADGENEAWERATPEDRAAWTRAPRTPAGRHAALVARARRAIQRDREERAS